MDSAAAAGVRTTAAEQVVCYSVGMGSVVAYTAVELVELVAVVAEYYCRRTPRFGLLETVQYSENPAAVGHMGLCGS